MGNLKKQKQKNTLDSLSAPTKVHMATYFLAYMWDALFFYPVNSNCVASGLRFTEVIRVKVLLLLLQDVRQIGTAVVCLVISGRLHEPSAVSLPKTNKPNKCPVNGVRRVPIYILILSTH